MLHEPVGGPLEEDKAESYKTRLGLWMFLFYAIFYAGFVAINVFNPKAMEFSVGSVNLAVVYGFALIIVAVIQALIYNHMCTKKEASFNK